MDVRINELLCYMFAKYGKMPADSIKSVIVSFYDGDEILCAKDLCAGELNLDGAPRCVQRRKDEKKTNLDTDDLLGLVAFLDERGTLDSLPKFVAANLERIPPLQSDVLDICLAVNRIAVLESKMEQLMMNYVQPPVSQPPTVAPSAAKPSAVSDAASATEVRPDGPEPPTWSTLATEAAKSGDEWQVVSRPQRKLPKPAIRVRGTKAAEGSVTAIPRLPATPQQLILAAFVGRLHLDTTEEQLTEYLKEEGMKGVVCRKLKPKAQQTFRTAAFYVSCCIESADLFYNEQCWPDGVELRDWVFKRSS